MTIFKKQKIMIKTIKKFKVSPPSAKEEKLCKLVFDDIRTTKDFKNAKITIHYNEYIVLEENASVEKEVIDSNGDYVYDEQGNKVIETVIEDILVRNNIEGTKSKTIPFSVYNAIATQVKPNFPAGISRTDEDNLIVEMGLKVYTVQKGYYEGITMVDYEN